MNKKLLTAVVGATLAVAGNAANAIDLKISGHLARGIMWADDGVTSEIYHVDMTTSPSRIRFLASDEIAPGITAGVNWENGFNSNGSGAVSQSTRSVAATLAERHQEIYFSGAFGRLGFGQGNGATKDGISTDLSQTDLAAGGAPVDIGGGLLFRTAGGGTVVALSSVLANFDTARYDRVRYDSPALGPVVLSASSGYNGEVDTTEFAARVNMDLGAGGKLAGFLGLFNAKSGGKTTSEAGGDVESKHFAVSWVAPMGLNVTLAVAKREDDASLDAEFNRLKVGYIAGQHAVSVHYAVGKDQAATDDEAKEVGLAYNFKPKPWADVFASVKKVTFDRTGVTSEDLDVVLVGSRIVF